MICSMDCIMHHNICTPSHILSPLLSPLQQLNRAEEKKRMDEEEKKVKEEERLRMEAAKKKEQEEEKQRLEAEAQAKKKKEREEEKRRIQERIANMESSKDKKDWHKTYKEWQMKYAR